MICLIPLYLLHSVFHNNFGFPLSPLVDYLHLGQEIVKLILNSPQNPPQGGILNLLLGHGEGIDGGNLICLAEIPLKFLLLLPRHLLFLIFIISHLTFLGNFEFPFGVCCGGDIRLSFEYTPG